jgi:hypothetical protein
MLAGTAGMEHLAHGRAHAGPKRPWRFVLGGEPAAADLG